MSFQPRMVTVESPVILVLGIAMSLLGLTGILRRVTLRARLSPRDQAIERVLNRLLGIIWFLTGAAFVMAAVINGPTLTQIVGYTSMVAVVAFFIALLGALIMVLAARRKPPRPRPLATPTGVSVPLPPRYRYLRGARVVHDEHGIGWVLASYMAEGREYISVMFRNETLNLPVDTVHVPAPPEPPSEETAPAEQVEETSTSP